MLIRGCKLIFAFLLLSGAVVFAGQPALKPRQCFDEMSKFGAPDITKAIYVKVQCWQPGAEQMLNYDFETSGNGWLLRETRMPGQPARASVLVNGVEPLEVEWAEDWSAKAEDALASPQAALARAQWRNGSLLSDFRTAMRFLRWLDKEKYPQFHFNLTVCGKLALFAHQLDQAGETTHAEELLAALERRAGSQNAVISAALNLLANGQYLMVYQRFLADHDWAAYRDGVKSVQAKFGQNWRAAGGADFLLDGIEARLSGEARQHTASKNAPALNAVGAKLTADLLNARAIRCKPEYGSAPVLWLAPSSWQKEGLPPDPDLAIRARGIAALPMLLALRNDDALTEIDALAVQLRSYSVNGSTDPDQVFEAMRRPATRGEAAERILREMLPKPLCDKHGSGKELASAAEEFFARHQHDTETELAVAFLPGDYGLDPLASRFLLMQARQKRLPALEEFLAKRVETPDSSGIWRSKAELCAQYGALRGPEVQPLLAQVAAALRQEAAEYKKPANRTFSNSASERQHIEGIRSEYNQLAQKLEAVRCPKNAEELLDQAASAPYQSEMLNALLEAIPRREAAGLLLRKASKDSNKAGSCRALLLQLRENIAAGTGGGPAPAEFKDEWTALIQRDEEFLFANEALFAAPLKNIPARRPRWRGDDTKHSAADAARALCETYGAEGIRFVTERVKARLAGTSEAKLLPYPCEQSLSGAETAALKTKFANVRSQTGVQAVFAQLSLRERESLPEMLRADQSLNAKLHQLASIVGRISTDPANPAQEEKFARWKGKPISSELARELEEWCKNEAQAGRPATCVLGRQRQFKGCELKFSAAAAETAAGGFGVACAPGLYQEVNWRCAPPPKETDWRAVATSGSSEFETFWSAVESVAGTGTPACSESFIQFGTLEDQNQ